MTRPSTTVAGDTMWASLHSSASADIATAARENDPQEVVKLANGAISAAKESQRYARNARQSQLSGRLAEAAHQVKLAAIQQIADTQRGAGRDDWG